MTSLPQPPSDHHLHRRLSTVGDRARIAAVTLVLVEAAGLIGVVLWWAGTVLSGGPGRTSELFLAAFALAVAAALVAGARALYRRGRGSRGPLITWQVLQAATATSVLGVPAAAGWAVAVLVLSAAVVALLLVPGVVDVVVRADTAEPPPAP